MKTKQRLGDRQKMMNSKFRSFLNLIGVPLFTVSLLLSACETGNDTKQEHKRIAEQLFRSVYGGNYTGIDSLISDSIEASYPIFKQLFGSGTIRGREAYKNFTIGFNKRWTDAQINIHETIAEDKSVVLVWSFNAKRVLSEQDSSGLGPEKYGWNGFTLYHFNEAGKIISETGEESSPVPFDNLHFDGGQK